MQLTILPLILLNLPLIRFLLQLVTKLETQYHFLSNTSFRIQVYVNDNKDGHATAFIYQVKGKSYLVTNLHCFTGLHGETFLPLSNHGGVPDCFEVSYRYKAPHHYNPPLKIRYPLYQDGKPVWYVHPGHFHKVDVGVLPIQIEEGLNMSPINNYRFDDFPLNVASDVYIIGFPLPSPLISLLDAPIWKKGSIASEPIIRIDGLPKFYIDTATRKGMSGSPVICKRSGLDVFAQGKEQDTKKM